MDAGRRKDHGDVIAKKNPKERSPASVGVNPNRSMNTGMSGAWFV